MKRYYLPKFARIKIKSPNLDNFPPRTNTKKMKNQMKAKENQKETKRKQKKQQKLLKEEVGGRGHRV